VSGVRWKAGSRLRTRIDAVAPIAAAVDGTAGLLFKYQGTAFSERDCAAQCENRCRSSFGREGRVVVELYIGPNPLYRSNLVP